MKRFFLAWVYGIILCTTVPIIVITGCTTSQQRVSYNSLFTVGKSVDAAYRSYLDAVISGAVKTNDVPAISASYNQFQQSFGAAVQLLTLNTNAGVPPAITEHAAQLISNISKAKGTK